MKVLDENGDDGWKEWRKNGIWEEHYTEHGCPEEPNAPPVRVLVRVPADVKPREKLPVVFSIPGGGMCRGGSPEGSMGFNYRAIKGSGMRVVLVSPQYRLAPASKYPASINDCHAAYQWMLEHSQELHINQDKIVLFGASTGGHVALSLPFRLKKYDYHGKMPRGIVTMTPVMDDVAFTDSGELSFANENGNIDGWDAALNQISMRMWLGDRFGDPSLPPEAVPNRAKLDDMANYPPVWFASNHEFEPSRDSAYKFAALLHKAGVFCEVHVWGATSHASAASENNPLMDRLWAVISGSLRDALTYDFRRLWLWK